MSQGKTHNNEECDVLSSNTKNHSIIDGPKSVSQVIKNLDKSKVTKQSSLPDDNHTKESPYKDLARGQCFEEGEFKCSICEKTFFSLNYFNFHTKLHSEDKAYKSKVKDLSIKKSASLGAQSELKPYKCTVCSKRFCQVVELLVHLPSHDGEDSFRCQICEKGFTQFQSLNIHKRTHIGEKRYECIVCGKKFTQNGRLTIHMRTHTGETPYNCEVCEKKFHIKKI